jgi:NAD-dependent DNA ligase
MDHTAHNIVELFHYFQKRWEDHTSMLETQTLNIPSLNGKPPLIRRWAAELTGVGVKTSMDAQKHFKSAIRMATADEVQWFGIPGIGVPTAQRIVREIHEERP